MKRIMIVEDHQPIRETLAEILRDLGYEVEEAAEGEDALHQLHTAPEPALILLDLDMPRMNGVDFCAQKEAEPALAAIPVVVITASNRTPDSCPVHSAGWFSKPFHFDALLSLIEKHAA